MFSFSRAVHLYCNGEAHALSIHYSLARNLHVSRHTLCDWEQGTQIPQLGTLLRLCYQFSISPLNFMTEEIEPSALSQARPVPPIAIQCATRTRPRAFDALSLRQRLNEALTNNKHTVPSMRQVSRRIGCDPSLLAKHFPELCRAISERYKNQREKQSALAIQRICAEVRQVTIDTAAQGLYPSHKRLRRALSKPGYMRCAEARSAWRVALRELGWARDSAEQETSRP